MTTNKAMTLALALISQTYNAAAFLIFSKPLARNYPGTLVWYFDRNVKFMLFNYNVF